ncbi:hypothetical protein JJB09_08120 [Rhizobium sp. KVB221]|uniref:Uncharacterized protein n=1 Tax=Rhizobium setariae TaxID=2801340 RepID=A0A937CLS4_9HYPH|nr:hypothetical protein [Rhizobium setariae]MBL0371991.1 hypothetical protein [Rhizobium setariae]
MSQRRADEAAIWVLINDAWKNMSLAQRRLWETISITPEKWTYKPHSNPVPEAWVVAIIGTSHIWYDDYYDEMYDGFYVSEHCRYGETIAQMNGGGGLETAVQILLEKIVI